MCVASKKNYYSRGHYDCDPKRRSGVRPLCCIVLALVIFILPRSAARAEQIVATVDKTAQRLTVEVEGVKKYEWPISTARRGYQTPNGSYRPEWLARKWFSRQYDWSPMPYSIFFSGGYAIHGSYEISHLGSPASHGCIRLHPENAAILFALVKTNMDSTHIVVTGESPNAARETRAARKPHKRHIEWWEKPVFIDARAPINFVDWGIRGKTRRGVRAKSC